MSMLAIEIYFYWQNRVLNIITGPNVEHIAQNARPQHSIKTNDNTVHTIG